MGVVISGFIIYSIYTIESKLSDDSGKTWRIIYILGICYEMLISPILNSLFNCILVVILAKVDLDGTVYKTLKECLDRDIVTMYNL